ncbi:MAG: GDSL family lipase [Bacteroidetes bacterium]|nr:GDSL family lipase [Bacteroidota bacterium]
MIKKILITLLLILIFTSFARTQTDSIKKDTSIYLKNPRYLEQTKLYDIYKMKRAKIVMLGNSITHGANWNELINRKDVVERGISGDLTSGFLHRLKYVYNLKPKICFIMGGINDIIYGKQVDEVFQNLIKIADSLKSHKIKIVLQSTLFIKNGSSFLDTINVRVKSLNIQLKKYASINNIIFLDLNKKLSVDNHLKEEHTIDGVHLSALGYKIWSNYILQTLIKLKI